MKLLEFLQNLKPFFTISALVTLLLSSCKSDGDRQKQEKPNIIFIMSDDHTFQSIGAYDSRFNSLDPAPTIDRLAEEGMMFENAFCTNSISIPSRATILTGQFSHTNGVRGLYDSIPPKMQYLPKELNKAGYQTAVVGKWHGRSSPAAFDYFSVLSGQGNYNDPFLYSRNEGSIREIRIDSKLTRERRVKQYQGHTSDIITDISLDWLKNKREKDKPFFLMHHFKAPHEPFQYKEKYSDYLEDLDFPMPEAGYEPEWGSVATRGHNDSLIDYIGSSLGKRNHIRDIGGFSMLISHFLLRNTGKKPIRNT